jgi:hypothetical protein
LWRFKILESVAVLKEAGAAVALRSGVINMLRSWGIDPVSQGAVAVEEVRVYNGQGELLNTLPMKGVVSAPDSREGGSHLLRQLGCYRADLHASLRARAVAEDGPGRPCKLLLSHRVVHAVSISTRKRRITLTANFRIRRPERSLSLMAPSSRQMLSSVCSTVQSDVLKLSSATQPPTAFVPVCGPLSSRAQQTLTLSESLGKKPRRVHAMMFTSRAAIACFSRRTPYSPPTTSS